MQITYVLNNKQAAQVSPVILPHKCLVTAALHGRFGIAAKIACVNGPRQITTRLRIMHYRFVVIYKTVTSQLNGLIFLILYRRLHQVFIRHKPTAIN